MYYIKQLNFPNIGEPMQSVEGCKRKKTDIPRRGNPPFPFPSALKCKIKSLYP